MLHKSKMCALGEGPWETPVDFNQNKKWIHTCPDPSKYEVSKILWPSKNSTLLIKYPVWCRMDGVTVGVSLTSTKEKGRSVTVTHQKLFDRWVGAMQDRISCHQHLILPSVIPFLNFFLWDTSSYRWHWLCVGHDESSDNGLRMPTMARRPQSRWQRPPTVFLKMWGAFWHQKARRKHCMAIVFEKSESIAWQFSR